MKTYYIVTLSFCFFAFMINFTQHEITRAKKISFFEQGVIEDKSYELETEIIRELSKFIDKNTINNKISFKFLLIQKNKTCQPYFKQLTDVFETIKLFSIPNKFVISLKTLEKDSNYEKLYKLIKDSDNALALYLLSEINKSDESKFFYFWSNLLSVGKFVPSLFEYSSLNIFRKEKSFENLFVELESYKKIYNDLRRLLFSYPNKSKYIGSFLFGDYLWAINIVKNHSIKIGSQRVLIPGTEFLKINGLMNLKNEILNCCIQYEAVMGEEFTDVYAKIRKEDLYEFYDKYPNATKIILNPSLNNEDLFFNYGIIPIDTNPFDYITLNISELINEKWITLSTSTNHTEPTLKLSCTQHDLNNVIYYFKSKNIEYFEENMKKVLQFLSSEVTSLDIIFEQRYPIDNELEVKEILKYLSKKKSFYINLEKCLKEALERRYLNQTTIEQEKNFDEKIDQNNGYIIKEEF